MIPPFPGLPAGREGLKQVFKMFWDVARLRAQGRFENPLAGIPPAGKDMEVTAIAVHRIADGKIVEHWSEVDSAALMWQLGLISLPEGSGPGG